VPSRSISAMSASYSVFEPSHHTTLEGRVRPAVSATHFSATLVTLIGSSQR